MQHKSFAVLSYYFRSKQVVAFWFKHSSLTQTKPELHLKLSTPLLLSLIISCYIFKYATFWFTIIQEALNKSHILRTPHFQEKFVNSIHNSLNTFYNTHWEYSEVQFNSQTNYTSFTTEWNWVCSRQKSNNYSRGL